MRLYLDQASGAYVFDCTREERVIPQSAGFTAIWNENGMARSFRWWATANPRTAIKLAGYADDELRAHLLEKARDIPDPDKCSLVVAEGQYRWHSPKAKYWEFNGPPKQSGFRFAKDTESFWWAENITQAVDCYKAALEAGFELVIAPGLAAELNASIEAHSQTIEASRATDAQIDIPCPEGQKYMPFQKAGVAYALHVFGDL